MKWGSKLEIEIRNRIMISIYAYAYECEDESLITDHEFDKLAKQIKPNMKTGRKKLDKFFEGEFSTDTGLWIYSHPELKRIKELYKTHHQL